MPEALSFCLARAQRPLLHVDRSAHLKGWNDDWFPCVAQQRSSRVPLELQSCQDEACTAGVTPRLQLVKDQSTLYLGETCVFYLTLGNQGSSEVSSVTVRVECSVEGGSSSVLYDNSQSPLPQLPPTARHEFSVQTDVREQGVVSIVASAVFTDRVGERKYHVQFFKFTTVSPLAVKTRVRCLPHVQQTAQQHNSSSSASEHNFQLNNSSNSSKSYCFLEVSVENSTQLPLLLHAVNLLPSAGLTAKQLSLWQLQDAPGQQQEQQQPLLVPQHHVQNYAPAKRTSDGSKETIDDSSDTKMLHDIGDVSSSTAAAAAAGSSLEVHQPLTQQHMSCQQPEQQQLGVLGPLLGGQLPLTVLHPAGGSHNYLWQVDLLSQHRSSSSDGSAAAAAAAQAAGSSSSSSNAFLGRLELHWSSSEGKTGKLLTQPLSRPLSTAAGRDVIMQLSQLRPAAAAAESFETQPPPPFVDYLEVGVPVRAVFTLTAAAGLQQQQGSVGPLLVLYTELSPSGPAVAGSSSARTSDGSGQQPQGAYSGNRTVSATGSSQLQRPGSSSSSVGGGSSSRDHPAVAVQGRRSQRVARLSSGSTVDVDFVLLPLRRGWLRLPTFVVVSEPDGRLLDSVHDVQLMVT